MSEKISLDSSGKIYIFINRIDTEYTFGQIYCISL